MVSKGVDYYSYAANADITATITAPGHNITRTARDNFTSGNLQISSGNISGALNYIGRLEWKSLLKGREIATGHEDISSLDGQMKGGTMSEMLKTPSVIGNDFAVSYGFYDAGSGIGTGLTNQDQLYVHTTPNRADWMGEIMRAYPVLRDRPFSRFALPGAHDAGMFTMATVDAIISDPVLLKVFLGVLSVLSLFAGAVVFTAKRQAEFGIHHLALTQKDNVPTMLDLGTRYFDFRPGKMIANLSMFTPNVRYHQHTAIPGQPYIQFLEDVLRWLAKHPSEIVVVSANTQGFADAIPPTTAQDVADDLAAAFRNTGLSGKVGVGDKAALGQSYDQLMAANTRLIFLNQIAGETTKYDSYNGKAYATVDPAAIVGCFEKMTKADQQGYTYTVLQMQGTATSLGAGVVVPAIATNSWAYSPLMCTKANFDRVTNPWLRNNVVNRFDKDKLIVFLNDFVDNQMTETAITLSLDRLGLAP